MTRDSYHLGLIGYPLGHSRSPVLHHAAMGAYGLAGEYQLFAIPPTEEGILVIQARLADLRCGRLHGINVTIPHKQTVMPFVDRLSEVARAVGAVNTLYLDGSGRLVGDNTDVPGFLHDLERLVHEKVGRATVLGAGGSARAVVYGLAQAGWQVTVMARRADQSAQLAAEIGASSGKHIHSGVLDLDGLQREAINCDLIVNTTPLGMTPQVNGCPWPDDLPLPGNAAVYDLVYNPPETVLLTRAKQAGLPAMNGAGMLVAQAALAFEKWTGLEPPFSVMETAFYSHS